MLELELELVLELELELELELVLVLELELELESELELELELELERWPLHTRLCVAQWAAQHATLQYQARAHPPHLFSGGSRKYRGTIWQNAHRRDVMRYCPDTTRVNTFSVLRRWHGWHTGLCVVQALRWQPRLQ